MGAYHTIDLELNRKFLLAKQEWDSVALERIGKYFNPLMLTAAKNSLTILMKSCRQKHIWKIYLREKCYLEHYQQYSFEHFSKSFLVTKLSKV